MACFFVPRKKYFVNKLVLSFSISLLVFTLLNGTVLAVANWPADSGVEIGQAGNSHGLPNGFEPSGAVWHPRRETLLLVDDSGFVAELDPAVGVVNLWEMDEDFEGITLSDPASDLVYLAIEKPDGIMEFDLSTGEPTGNNWDLTSWLDGPNNRGLEALTWVDGLFYAGLQEDGKIYIFDLLPNGEVEYQGIINPHEERDDISGLHFDACTGTLYAIHDSHDVIVEMNSDGVFQREYELAGDSQEGVALVGVQASGVTTIFLAEDSGEVWMYEQYTIEPCEDLSSVQEQPAVNLPRFGCSPNPFNPRTEIFFNCQVSQSVQLSIYDVSGWLVRGLADGIYAPGEHRLVWNGLTNQGQPVSSGVYFARLQTSTNQAAIKLVLTR